MIMRSYLHAFCFILHATSVSIDAYLFKHTVIIITEKLYTDPILQSSLILAARAKTLRKQYYS